MTAPGNSMGMPNAAGLWNAAASSGAASSSAAASNAAASNVAPAAASPSRVAAARSSVATGSVAAVSPNAAAWAAARNVLCVRLDTLGDVLMTTPAIRALATSGSPDRRIALLTSPAGAAVAELVAEIDEVIVYEAPWLKASAPRRADDERRMADALRERGFDAAAIFTVNTQSPLPAALLCHLADIPLRLAHCRENPYQLLTDWIREPEPNTPVRHEVRRQLDLVAAVGATTGDERLAVRVPPEARGAVSALLAELGVDGTTPWAVVHVGASAPSRRYPPDQFALAARGLVERLGLRLVFTGTEAERPLVDEIREASGVPSVSTVGRIGLAELAALLERAPLLVANNTGPVHLAAAVGTPVVDLYALTNPQHTPWGVPSRVLSHDVPCRNCFSSVCPMGHHDCLRLVDPASVVDAAAELLGLIRREPLRRSRSLAGVALPSLPAIPSLPAVSSLPGRFAAAARQSRPPALSPIRSRRLTHGTPEHAADAAPPAGAPQLHARRRARLRPNG